MCIVSESLVSEGLLCEDGVDVCCVEVWFVAVVMCDMA